jgi:beta-glucosidase
VGPGSPAPSGGAAAYLDPTLPIDARLDDLLGRMTVEEKIGQLTLMENGSIDAAGVGSLLVGGVLSGGDGNPTPNDPDAWFSMVDGYQQAALRTRLRIPILYGVDAVHGQSHVVGATIFPHQIGLGATGDATLVEKVGRATAQETAATGIRWTYGPVVAVAQDVRWGRTYESFGQDPALVGRLSAALIHGLQGEDLAHDDAVAATAKHFVGDGGTAWGTSTADGYSIDQGVTPVDDATLRSVHLAPYQSALDAGARVVMASFSSTTAGKVHGDRHLLTDVLKGELGFTGFIVSDWGGVDQVVPGDYDAAVVQSMNAGIDMVMVPYDATRFQAAVHRALDEVRITQDRLDDAVRRIIRVKLEMGLFEQPMPAVDRAVVGSTANRALAADAVAASAVLLRTSAGALPVGAGGERVLLAGSAADDIGTQVGGWSITWQGGTGKTTQGTTLRAALEGRLGAKLTFAADGAFPSGTRAPVGVVVVAEPPYARGPGRFRDAPAARPGPRGRRPGAAARGPSRRRDLQRPAADARSPGGGRCRRRRMAPRHRGGRPVGRPAGEPAVRGHHPVQLAEDPRRRTPDRSGPCDGAVVPVGFGLTADGAPIGPPACDGG